MFDKNAIPLSQYRQEGLQQAAGRPVFSKGAIRVTDEADGLIKRSGKQFYNAVFAAPMHSLTKPDVELAEIKAHEIQKSRIKARKSKGVKRFDNKFLDDEFDDLVQQLYLRPEARESEDLKGVPQFEKRQDMNPLAASVPPPETWKEKGIDMGSGLAGTIAQIALLRKVLPTGTSESVVWEVHNQMTGGKPGMGAVMGATIGAGGKLGKTTLEKATAEGLGMYVVNRIEGATPEEALSRAAVPVAFRGIGALRRAGAKRLLSKELAQAKTSLIKEGEKRPLAKLVQAETKIKGKVKPTFESTRKELVAGLKETKRLQKGVIRQAQRVEHGKRAGQAEALKEEMIARGMPVGEALVKSRAAIAGPLMDKIPTYDPPKLAPMQWEAVSKTIDKVFKGKYYSKTRSQTAVNKLRKGIPLQNNEVELLGHILGPDFVNAAEKLQPWQARTWRNLEDISNLPKTLTAAFDVQMRRQSRWLKGRHPVLRWKAIGHNLSGYFSRKHAERIQTEVEASPWHEAAVKSGTSFWGVGYTLGARPEQYRTRILAKIPGVRKVYGASERGTAAGFNWLQQKLFDLKMEQFTRDGRKITPEVQRQVSEFNNTILGMFKPQPRTRLAAAQRALSPFMWSPTLTYSRVRTPSMLFTNPTMRKEVAATLSSYVGVTLMQLFAVVKAGQYLGAPVKTDWDPRSTDFGKVQIKNTRIDLFGDGGPYIRMFFQFLLGQKKTQAGRVIEQPRLKAVWNVAKNKRHPWIDALYSWISGKTPYGSNYWALPEGIDIKSKAGRIAFFGGREVVRRGVPFFLQSFVEAAYNDGWPTGLLALTDEFFSGSVVTYKPTKATQLQNFKNLVADIQHKEDWDDLDPRQQRNLRIQFRTEFAQMEKRVKVERAGRKSESYSLKQQLKAEKNVLSKLSGDNKRLIQSAGISVQVSRTMGDFWLNDKRYQRYQELIAQQLEFFLNRLQQTPAFTLRRNDKLLQTTVDRSREIARIKLRQEMRSRS